jgi:hypothetical protein
VSTRNVIIYPLQTELVSTELCLNSNIRVTADIYQLLKGIESIASTGNVDRLCELHAQRLEKAARLIRDRIEEGRERTCKHCGRRIYNTGEDHPVFKGTTWFHPDNINVFCEGPDAAKHDNERRAEPIE